MKINAAKCFSLRMTTSTKNQNTVVFTEPTFDINGTPVEACSYENAFKYLGIRFDPRGKMAPNVKNFEDITLRVLKSPLKPQQKLLLLRSVMLYLNLFTNSF